jgi:hypothetical protein
MAPTRIFGAIHPCRIDSPIYKLSRRRLPAFILANRFSRRLPILRPNLRQLVFFLRVFRMLSQNLILGLATNFKLASQMNIGTFQHSSHVGPPFLEDRELILKSSAVPVRTAMQRIL